MPDAVAHLQRSLELSRTIRDKDSMAWAFELLGAALSETESKGAARLLGAAEALRDRLGITLEGVELALPKQTLDTLRAGLSQPEFAAAFAAGRERPLEATVDQAPADR